MQHKYKQIEQEILQEFTAREENYLSESESSGIPPIGYLCLRTPVELIEGLGGLPLRIIPREGYDRYHFGNVRPDGCSFCRMIPSFINTWHYPKMKAIIAGGCCDQMRRAVDTLQRDLEIPVIFFGAPRVWEITGDYYFKEMKSAFNRLAEVLGKEIPEDTIRNRIHQRNRLKTKVGEMRSQGSLPTSLMHRVAASPMPAEKLLESLTEVQNYRPRKESSIRLMLAGSIPGVWELEAVESGGATVVADSTCLGDRAFYPLAAEYGDPLENLYKSYVDKNLCPHRRPLTPLIDFIASLAREREVDGIIYLTVKYCHPWGLSAERVKSELNGMPFLHIDDDFTSPAFGSFKTRVGAFAEMLKSKKRLSVY